MEKENCVQEEEEEEEVGPRSLLRSNMLSPHEVLPLSLPGSLTLRTPRNPFHVRSGTSLRYIVGLPLDQCFNCR